MLEYSARGDPSHPLLIFLHGFLGCKEDWEEMLPFFEKEYHCICIDLPYGNEMVEEIREFIGNRKPTLIGYSMGGRIAMQLDNFAKQLVILSAHLGLKTQQERGERLELDRKWSEELLTLTFETFLEKWYAQPLFHPLPTDLLQRRKHQNPIPLSQAILKFSLGVQDPIEQLSCPTLFLYGENDLKYRDHYCRLPKNSSIGQIEKSGHVIHLTNPSLCAEKILNWLKHESHSSLDPCCTS